MTLYSAPKLLICNFGCYGIAFWYRSSIILVSLQRYSVIAPASFWSCPIVIPAQAGIHIFGRNPCGNIDDWRGVMDAESSSA